MIRSLIIYETAKMEEIIDENTVSVYEKEKKSKIIDNKKHKHL